MATSPMKYVKNMPITIPAGWRLAHNGIKPGETLRENGFRAFVVKNDEEGFVPCLCGWAPQHEKNYIGKGWAEKRGVVWRIKFTQVADMVGLD